MRKHYHALTIYEARPNAEGCVAVDRFFGSNASDLDELARERAEIASRYSPNQIIALSSHFVGCGPAVKSEAEAIHEYLYN